MTGSTLKLSSSAETDAANEDNNYAHDRNGKTAAERHVAGAYSLMKCKRNSLMSIKVLGSRGSMPVSGKDISKYGGNTSCYLLETDKDVIILDAGTGIMNLPLTDKERISILISHAHIDHILGLPMLSSDVRSKELTIYGKSFGGLDIRQQLDRFLSPPLWPVGSDLLFPKLQCISIGGDGADWDKDPERAGHDGDQMGGYRAGNDGDQMEVDRSGYDANQMISGNTADSRFEIGNGIIVDTMPSNHPGGSTIFGINYRGKRVVYATDYEHSPESFQALAEFSNNADLILYDAQYTEQEYESCRGFGHSTYEKGIELRNLSGAGHMLLIHHAPFHCDSFLDDIAERLPEDVSLAREGMSVEL